MANSRNLCLLGHRDIGKVKQRTLAVSALWDTEKLTNQTAKSRSLRKLGHREVEKNQTANSHKLCLLGHGEFGKVKQRTLVVSTHWGTKNLAKSNRELLQSPHIGTPRNWLSQTANYRSLRSLGHKEIGKVKPRTIAVSAHWDT